MGLRKNIANEVFGRSDQDRSARGGVGGPTTSSGGGLRTKPSKKVQQQRDDNKAANDPMAKALSFLETGEKKGEELTGATTAEVGEGRADIRTRLQEILGGNSAGAQSLKQDQGQAQKQLKSKQALAGGGQMNEGQQQALKRQADMDYAKFVSNEKRQALSDLSKEFRGAGGDIMRSSGQYGSVLTGSQPAAAPPKESGGLLSWLF